MYISFINVNDNKWYLKYLVHTYKLNFSSRIRPKNVIALNVYKLVITIKKWNTSIPTLANKNTGSCM